MWQIVLDFLITAGMIMLGVACLIAFALFLMFCKAMIELAEAEEVANEAADEVDEIENYY